MIPDSTHAPQAIFLERRQVSSFLWNIFWNLCNLYDALKSTMSSALGAKVSLLTAKTNLTTLLLRRAEPTLRSRGLQKNWSKVKCFPSSPCSLWYLDMLSKLPPCDMLCMVCVIWAIEHACICSNFWRTARFIQWHRVWLKCHTYHVNEMKCSKRCRCNIFFVCF